VRAREAPSPAGTYSIKLVLALSDDAAANSVCYTLRVTTLSGIELARRFGTATTKPFR
jgi:hypothetical protein